MRSRSPLFPFGAIQAIFCLVATPKDDKRFSQRGWVDAGGSCLIVRAGTLISPWVASCRSVCRYMALSIILSQVCS